MAGPGSTAPDGGQSTSHVDGPALTRGFLFCDLRGYTAFVEAQGDRAAANLLEAFRMSVRGAIGETGGGEIRTEGDSFYVVFASASAAVRCGLEIVARAAQAATDHPDRPINVGVGIHAGESVEGPEGYVGSAVNIAARVCAQAAAGEVLVTDTVRSLVRTSLDVRFKPRGRPHLKGIAEPIELFAVSRTSAGDAAAGRRSSGWVPSTARIRSFVLGAGLVAVIAIGAFLATIVVQAIRPSASPGASAEPSGGVVDVAALPGRIVFRSTQQLGTGSPPNAQVFVAKPDGTARRQLTPLTVRVLGFRVRPDLGKIVYLTTDNDLAIASLDASGSTGWPGPWRLSDFYQGARLANIELFGWLPSGELLIASTPQAPRMTAKLAANGQSLVPLGAPGCPADAARVASGEDLTASPDSGLLAFRSGRDIWLVSPDSCPIQVTSNVSAAQPAWSPDGSRLVFRGQTAGAATDIWTVNANGTGLRRLTADAEADENPTWSPDGAWIAWDRTVGTDQRLWVMRADGSGAIQLPIGERGEQLGSPIWTPEPNPAVSPSPTPFVPNPFTIVVSYSAAELGLDQPIALAIGPNGNVYITDQSPSVTAVDAFGARVTRWGTQGTSPGHFDFAGYNNHGSIAVGPDGQVYVSDSGNDRVQVFDPTGGFVRQFGTGGDGDGQFALPFDLSADAAGNVYVLDDDARNLQKFSPAGRFLWKVDQSTLPDMTGHGHNADVDSRGRIVVGNDDTGRVLYLDPTGREVDAFDGQACGVTVDPVGNTYVAGCGSDTIEVFDPAHRLIGRWSGPAMPLDQPPEFGPNGEIFALGKDGSLVKLKVTLSGQ